MKEETRDPPVHYYDHDATGRLTRIACGVAASRYTTDPLKVSCRKCAKEAQGMTDAQREEAWQNANERLDIENVAALASRGLDYVLADLAALGFEAEWGVFRASEAGAPHLRARLFILGHSPCFGCVEGWAERSGDAGLSASCDGGATVAHPLLDRLERGEREVLADPRGGGQHPSTLGSGGEVLAHGHGHGREGERSGGVLDCLGPTCGGHADGCGCTWPPGPDDRDGWREYLKRWPGLEPALRREADGMAGCPHAPVQVEIADEEKLSEENGATGNRGDEVSGMRLYEGAGAPPSRHHEAVGGRGALRPLSRQGGHQGRDEARGSSGDLRSLRGSVSAEAEQAIEVVRSGGVSIGAGAARRGEALGSTCMCHRVDRLRLLGNGVVPHQAALAFVELHRRLMGTP